MPAMRGERGGKMKCKIIMMQVLSERIAFQCESGCIRVVERDAYGHWKPERKTVAIGTVALEAAYQLMKEGKT